jgi:hypothetical protein
MPPPDPSADQARTKIEAALGQIGFCLPGTITIRQALCGKPRCACTADPPSLHGPYIQWTRTVKGKPSPGCPLRRRCLVAAWTHYDGAPGQPGRSVGRRAAPARHARRLRPLPRRNLPRLDISGELPARPWCGIVDDRQGRRERPTPCGVAGIWSC